VQTVAQESLLENAVQGMKQEQYRFEQVAASAQ
jgi:hypothetical protein